MAWSINGNTIQAPANKTIKHDIQEATRRTLDGSYTRDYIGSEKKVFICEYPTISKVEYDWIRGFYENQRDNGTTMTLVIDEISFNAPVIIDLEEYDLPIPNHYNWRALKLTFIEI